MLVHSNGIKYTFFISHLMWSSEIGCFGTTHALQIFCSSSDISFHLIFVHFGVFSFFLSLFAVPFSVTLFQSFDMQTENKKAISAFNVAYKWSSKHNGQKGILPSNELRWNQAANMVNRKISFSSQKIQNVENEKLEVKKSSIRLYLWTKAWLKFRILASFSFSNQNPGRRWEQ